MSYEEMYFTICHLLKCGRDVFRVDGQPDGVISEEKEDEALATLKELIKDKDKYKWHDLRKNPNDLPVKDGEYYVYQYVYFLTSPDPNSERCELAYCTDWFENGRFENGYDGGKVIAWREIEPFEEDE